MKTLSYWACLLPLLSLASPAADERPQLVAKEGRSVRKVYSATGSLALADATMSIDGEDHPAPEGMRSERGFELELTVLDDFLAVADGRVTKLRRAYEELSRTEHYLGSGPQGEQSRDADMVSDLAGEAVVFTWDEDEEDYAAAWDEDSEGDDALLAELDGLLELDDFLPQGEVAVDDTWELDAALVDRLLEPFGDLGMYPDDMDGPPERPDAEPEVTHSGELVATYAGTRDADGVRVAVIRLAIDVEIARDMTAVARASVEDADAPEGSMVPDFESVIDTLAYEGEASLYWDVENGLLHSMELSCDVELENAMASSFEVQGGTHEMERTSTFEGSRTAALRFER